MRQGSVLFPYQSMAIVGREQLIIKQQDNLPQQSWLRPIMVHPFRLGEESKFCKLVATCTKYSYYKLWE